MMKVKSSGCLTNSCWSITVPNSANSDKSCTCDQMAICTWVLPQSVRTTHGRIRVAHISIFQWRWELKWSGRWRSSWIRNFHFGCKLSRFSISLAFQPGQEHTRVLSALEEGYYVRSCRVQWSRHIRLVQISTFQAGAGSRKRVPRAHLPKANTDLSQHRSHKAYLAISGVKTTALLSVCAESAPKMRKIWDTGRECLWLGGLLFHDGIHQGSYSLLQESNLCTLTLKCYFCCQCSSW